MDKKMEEQARFYDDHSVEEAGDLRNVSIKKGTIKK